MSMNLFRRASTLYSGLLDARPFAAPVVAAVLAGLLALAPAKAGTLDPPAPPAPTMKTLQEVEPRTPIQFSVTPIMITQPGSYYLAGNLDFPGPINVSAPDVTIDLSGFRIDKSSGGDAIFATAQAVNLQVRNGTIARATGAGIRAENTARVSVRNVRFEGNGGKQIWLGVDATVSDCFVRGGLSDGVVMSARGRVERTTSSNNAGTGMILGDSSSVMESAAHNNATGISIGKGTVSDCRADGNSLAGIQAGDGATVIRCGVAGNSLFGGITMGSGSFVTLCTVRSTLGHGIVANGTGGAIVENEVSGCGNTGINTDGTGILIHIEGNYVHSNTGPGISVGNNDSCIVIRNRASNNGTPQYNIPSGNDFGPIGSAATATSPVANLLN